MCFHCIFRERVPAPKNETAQESSNDIEKRTSDVVASTLDSAKASQQSEGTENGGGYSARNLMKSASISGSKCIGVQSKVNIEVYKKKENFISLDEKILFNSDSNICEHFFFFIVFKYLGHCWNIIMFKYLWTLLHTCAINVKYCCVILQDAIAEEQDEIVAEVVEKVPSLHNTWVFV